MVEIEINAKISNIVKFEKKTGTSLMVAFSDKMSISTISELVKTCSNATDEDIDNYVKEFGFEQLTTKLIEAFKDSGFLPKETPQDDSQA